MFPPYTWYNVYDSNLIFMTNLDRVAEIGEDSSIVKDLSSYKHFATINGATYTASGKY